MRNRWRISCLLAIVASMFVSVGSRAAELVRLAAPMSPILVGTYIPKAKGFYSQEGLKVTSSWAGGARSRDGLFAKDYDFIIATVDTAAIARSKGMRFKIVAPIYERELFSLFASKKMRGADHPSDLKALLKGARVGMAGFGGGGWVFATTIYRKLGLDSKKDMVAVNLGGATQNYLGALRTGSVDAAVIWEPIITIAQMAGLALPLVDTRNSETHNRFFGKEVLTSTLITREDVIKEHPDLVRRMVGAVMKANAFARHASSRELAKLAMPFMKGGSLDMAGLTKMIAGSRAGFPLGGIGVSEFQTKMKQLVELGIVKKAIPFDELVDTSFAGRRN